MKTSNTTTSEETAYSVTSYSALVERTNTSNTIVSSILMVAGVALAAASSFLDENSSTLRLCLIMLGLAVIAYGLYRFMAKRKRLIYEPTGSPVTVTSYLFPKDCRHALVQMVEAGMFDLSKSYVRDPNGCLRLDVSRSADGRFAAMQLFAYEQLLFHPVTSVAVFTDAQAKSVSDWVAVVK